MIPNNRRAEITDALTKIEETFDVKILHAIESGSRAWGFPSADSDFDVRIIYLHPRDWYLSVFEGRDVIEQPISGDLDIGGWDLRKALRLLSSGNAVVHEWLASPIVYQQERECIEKLKNLATEAFDPRAAFYHYLAMAAKKLDVAADNQPTAKQVLYGIRTLLCAQWVLDLSTAPPMLFSELLTRYIPQTSSEFQAITNIVLLKAAGSENDVVAELEPLLQYARDWVEALKVKEAPQTRKLQTDYLDACFREILEATKTCV